MPPPPPIVRYHVLWFRDSADAEQFAQAMQRFVRSRAGRRYLTEPPRAVLWMGTLSPADHDGGCELFASEGALRAAHAAECTLGAALRRGTCSADRLPAGRVLLVGQERDWPPLQELMRRARSRGPSRDAR